LDISSPAGVGTACRGWHFFSGEVLLAGKNVMSLEVRPSRDTDITEVRAMVREYVDWIGLDLAFQEIDAEIDGLPGEYAPPRGALFVAEDQGRLIGMIGLRPLDEESCLAGAYDAKAGEMKRLFVRPEARGRGVAKRLITQVIAEARRLGYDEIRLDTLPMMGDAQALYVALGFHDIAPYYDSPIAGTRFMSKQL
jgi:putative acetyltransferase